VRHIRTFSLILALALGSSAAWADVVYIGDTGGADFLGAITQDSAGFTAHPNLVTGFKGGVNVACYSFKDMNGRDMILVNEIESKSGNDVIYIYDAADLSKPILNTKEINCYSVNGVAVLGKHLYLTCSGRFDPPGGSSYVSGSVIRLDMEDGYRETGRYDFGEVTPRDGSPDLLNTRGRDIYEYNGHIYVLTMAMTGMAGNYEASGLYKLDRDLNLVKQVWLGSGPDDQTGDATWKHGRLSNNMAFHNGYFYIATSGGSTTIKADDPSDMSGAIWRCDAHDDNMPVELLFTSMETLGRRETRAFHRVAVSVGGAVFLAGYGYESPNYHSALSVTSIANLDAGALGPDDTVQSYTNAPGRVSFAYDESSKTGWLMANRGFEAYDENGLLLARISEDEHNGTNNTVMLVPVESVNTGGESGGEAPSGCGAGAFEWPALAAVCLCVARSRRS
jgi:hypothetical protein